MPSTVWKLHKFTLIISLNNYANSTHIVLNNAVNCFHKIYFKREKIFRFSTLCRVLSDHLGTIHNKSHSISNNAVVATTRNGILTRKKKMYIREKKNEKKISGNFRASHCVRNKGLCYIFFAFFRKALGNTFSTLTRKKRLQKCSFLLQVERRRRMWTSFFLGNTNHILL